MRERRTDREQIADPGTHNTFIYERGGKIIYVQTIFAKMLLFKNIVFTEKSISTKMKKN